MYNWGTFNGLHTVDVARAGFLIFGPSGSGKSTLIDAVSTILGSPDVTVLTPQQPNPGRNPAEIWSPTAVVRGKKEHDADLDDVTRSFLRPGPMWSGVGLHFSDDDGGEITALRIMCLTANTTTQSEVKTSFCFSPAR